MYLASITNRLKLKSSNPIVSAQQIVPSLDFQHHIVWPGLCVKSDCGKHHLFISMKHPPLTPFMKEHNVSYLQINDILEYNFTLPTICLYPQSAFTHNPGTTHQIIYLVQLSLISLFKFRQVAFKQRFRLWSIFYRHIIILFGPSMRFLFPQKDLTASN